MRVSPHFHNLSVFDVAGADQTQVYNRVSFYYHFNDPQYRSSE